MSDFKAKMHLIRFPLVLRPRPRTPDLLAVFQGPTSRGKERVQGRGREMGEGEGRRRRKEGKERGRNLPTTPSRAPAQ